MYVTLLLLSLITALMVVIPTSFADQSIDRPLKQMHKGVLAKDVICPVNYKLLLKIEDKSAACVRPYTFVRLIARGWGMPPQISNMQKTTSAPTSNSPTSTTPSNNAITGIHLGFLTGNNPDNIPVLENNLNSGDYVFVNTPLGDDSNAQSILQEAADIKSKVKPGVHVYTLVWYSKIDDIESRVANLPKGIDYIIYDFEKNPNFTPEYTNDQQQAIALYDRAAKVAHANGFKLMVTPTYGDIKAGSAISRGWDWGEVATHMDALNIQFQGYFRLANADTISNDMSNIMQDISKKSPNTLAFVQLSLTPVGGTSDQNVNAIHALNQKGIHNFLIFYAGPQQTQNLQDFISKYSSK